MGAKSYEEHAAVFFGRHARAEMWRIQLQRLCGIDL